MFTKVGHMQVLKLIFFSVIFTGLVSCKDNDTSVAESREKVTEVSLIFSNVEGGAPLIYKATGMEGAESNHLIPEAPIVLDTNTSYQLFIRIENTQTGVDLTNKIDSAGTTHMVYFAFTNDLFKYPTGDGNIDQREPQAVEYLDEDDHGQPIGLITGWVTGGVASGDFRVLLKHQPQGTKESEAGDGLPDFDVTWRISVQ